MKCEGQDGDFHIPQTSTVRDADCIYMMENGRIVESGTHEQLLSKGGKYAAMWKMQAGLYADVSRYARTVLKK